MRETAAMAHIAPPSVELDEPELGEAAPLNGETAHSLRWRVRLFSIVMAVVMVAAYLAVSGEGMSPAANQITRLLLATAAAAPVIVTFFLVGWLLNRVNRVRRVIEALASGQFATRTGMKPTDEISALGYALDRYADHVQARQDALQRILRRQRREIAHLTSVLETLPDGVIVQDTDGRVIFINDLAKELLQARERSTSLSELTAHVTDVLGAALAPGLYALGDPRRIEVGGRMVSAQAAALMSLSNQRVGTVIVLRDITDEVKREQARELLLKRVAAEVQRPMARNAGEAALVRGRDAAVALATFAREMSRHSVALQKLIIEMRELTADLAPLTTRGQRALPVETLIWAVANEWRQVAQAAKLRMDVIIEQKGLFILGDERRLRWAIGNLVDNAIKYTPPGGAFTLEVKGESDGMARMRIRDNGAGISAEDLPNVFTRFFRGTPVTKDGRVIRVPGTGQGLSVAKSIIEAHGGKIYLKSKPGVGTAVYFALPVTAPVSLELPGSDALMDGETVQVKAVMH